MQCDNMRSYPSEITVVSEATLTIFPLRCMLLALPDHVKPSELIFLIDWRGILSYLISHTIKCLISGAVALI